MPRIPLNPLQDAASPGVHRYRISSSPRGSGSASYRREAGASINPSKLRALVTNQRPFLLLRHLLDSRLRVVHFQNIQCLNASRRA